jgi:hypothetical protein
MAISSRVNVKRKEVGEYPDHGDQSLEYIEGFREPVVG